MRDLIEAIYQDGVLKLKDRIDLKENQLVKLRIVEIKEKSIPEEELEPEAYARIAESRAAYKTGKSIPIQEYVKRRGLNVSD